MPQFVVDSWGAGHLDIASSRQPANAPIHGENRAPAIVRLSLSIWLSTLPQWELVARSCRVRSRVSARGDD